MAEKIRKINPKANIASIVLQPTPRGPVSSQASWNSDSASGPARRPSSRGTTPASANATLQSFSAKHLPSTRPFVRGDGSTMPSLASLSGGDGAAVTMAAVRSGGSETTAPVPARETNAAADSDVESPRSLVARKRRAMGIGSGLPDARPEKDSSKEENPPQASNDRRAFGTAAPPAASLAAPLGGSGGVEDGGGRGSVEGGRRSLMGRMLGSGMLERQREWAKARNRKVTHAASGGVGGGKQSMAR